MHSSNSEHNSAPFETVTTGTLANDVAVEDETLKPVTPVAVPVKNSMNAHHDSKLSKTGTSATSTSDDSTGFKWFGRSTRNKRWCYALQLTCACNCVHVLLLAVQDTTTTKSDDSHNTKNSKSKLNVGAWTKRRSNGAHMRTDGDTNDGMTTKTGNIDNSNASNEAPLLNAADTTTTTATTTTTTTATTTSTADETSDGKTSKTAKKNMWGAKRAASGVKSKSLHAS
eukprot:8057-Heterococcus_DN1.PRE.4